METSFSFPQDFPEAAAAFGIVFILFIFFVSLIVTLLMVWAYCRIFSKAGYSWALGLLMLIPIANIIMPFVLAFSDWPVCRELRELKPTNQQTY